MIKKYFTLVLVSLLSLSAFAYRYQGMMTLTLNGNPFDRVACTFDEDDETVTLGNGFNACISHYAEGELVIPSNYTRAGITWRVIIGPMAFRFCTGLTKVTIEEGVKTIGDGAFVGCSSLTHLTLPSTLQTVGSGAFSELASLHVVKCMATTAPTWQWNDVFAALGTKKSMEKMASTRILYIPSGSAGSYMNTKFDGTSTGTPTTANEKVGWQEAFNRIYELTTEPQTIGTLAELKAFRDAVNSGEKYKESLNNSVVLTADIDMASETNWTPIGTEGQPFDGVFDGGGHTIKNLCVNLPETDNVGLFGYANNATIYNLHLQDPVIKGKKHAGTLLGYGHQNVRISDVLVSGSVTGDDYYTVSGDGLACGGIVGRAGYNCSIMRCMFSGVVKGALSCGGILGDGYDVTISDCSASHNIQTKENTIGSAVGGIVGYAVLGDIERCLVRNTLTSNNASAPKIGYVMGEIDDVDYPRTLSIDNCAYWGYSNDINTVGKILTDELLTFTESRNQAFATEAGMMGEGAKAQLGDEWTYFTGNYTDYPIPITLKDMYMRQVLCQDEYGLVYSPVGTATSPSAYEVYAYTGDATELSIPDNLSNKPVTAILPEVFKGNSTLQTLTIGSNVTDIGESAFEDCDALTAVVLPDAVEYVHARAFRGCDNLTTFTIGTGFEHHDDNFFADCPKLSTLQMSGWNKYGYRCEDNVLTHQSDYWFAYIIACAPGKTGDYTIPTYYQINKIEIFPDCFGGCTGLTSITFPAGMKYAVGKGAFRGATNLRYIDMHSIEGTVVRESDTHTTYTADRHDPDSPFYGLSQSTIVYLPDGHTAADGEPNIVINGTANSLILNDDWDFNPPVDITATNGVHFNRKLQATRTEITQPTGNKITLKDENDQDVEVDELEVTGYTYAPRGYSVCLPYDLTLTAENAKVFVPSAITEGDDWRVSFTEVTDKKMDAYKPYYIVVSGEEEVNLSSNEKNTRIESAYTAVYPQTVGDTDFEFKGTTTAISNANLYNADKPAYILQSDGNWHKVPANTEDAYVPPFRAYLQASNAKTANQLITMLNAIDLSDVLDNSTVLAKYAGQTVSVTLRDRTLYMDGDWNTLCLPFNVSAEQMTATTHPLYGAIIKELNATTSNLASDGTLTLNFTTANSIEAGKPYIVKWEGASGSVSNPVFTNVIIDATAPTPVTFANNANTGGDCKFVGQYSPFSIVASGATGNDQGNLNEILMLGSGSTLGYSKNPRTLKTFRCHFFVPANDGVQLARAFVLDFGDGDGEQTGIISITADQRSTDGSTYTLDGRKLNGKPTAKGVYIQNGRKVVIK